MNFALLGVAGFVAPRHLQAIKDTGHTLVAALDPSDSVGILDRYFPEAHFFTEFERFDRHLDKQRRAGTPVDYLTVCTPNYLHDAHIRYGLRLGADVVCEKPLVLNPWNLDAITALEQETGRRVNCLLQLRHHPALLALRARLDPRQHHQVDLTYLVRRGRWYDASWKGDEAKGGGIMTNLGIHLFDLLQWLFGPPTAQALFARTPHTATGWLHLERATVRWFLSSEVTRTPRRELTIDGEVLEFSDGFTNLHTVAYEALLAGQGCRAADTRTALTLVHTLRHAPLAVLDERAHPLARE